jgi:hypothetical protein
MPLSAQLAHLEEMVLELGLSAMKQIDVGILDERKHGRRKNTT